MSRALCGCAGCVQQKQILCSALALPACALNVVHVHPGQSFHHFCYLTLSYTASSAAELRFEPRWLDPSTMLCLVALGHFFSVWKRYYLGMCVLFIDLLPPVLANCLELSEPHGFMLTVCPQIPFQNILTWFYLLILSG